MKRQLQCDASVAHLVSWAVRHMYPSMSPPSLCRGKRGSSWDLNPGSPPFAGPKEACCYSTTRAESHHGHGACAWRVLCVSPLSRRSDTHQHAFSQQGLHRMRFGGLVAASRPLSLTFTSPSACRSLRHSSQPHSHRPDDATTSPRHPNDPKCGPAPQQVMERVGPTQHEWGLMPRSAPPRRPRSDHVCVHWRRTPPVCLMRTG